MWQFATVLKPRLVLRAAMAVQRIVNGRGEEVWPTGGVVNGQRCSGACYRLLVSLVPHMYVFLWGQSMDCAFGRVISGAVYNVLCFNNTR